MEFKQLTKILGKRAITDPLILDSYSYDASSLTMIPKIVLRPHSTIEVKKVIDYANRYNQKIVPRGRATNNVGGAITTNILLDMSAMNKYKIDIDKGFIDLQPGVVLSNIEFPKGKGIDLYPCTLVPPTIGGLIASGIHSRYDSQDEWWDNFLEIEAIDGTGKIYKFNNVSELWATEGILFIITAIRMKIKDINNYRSYSFSFFDSLIDALMHAKHSRNDSNIRAIDIFNPKMLSFLKLPDILIDSKKWLVLNTYDAPTGDIKESSKTAKINEQLSRIDEVMASHQWISQESIIHKEYYFDVLNQLNKQGLPLMLHYLSGYLHIYTMNGEISNLMDIYDYLLMHSSQPGGHGYGLLKKRYVPIGMKRRFMQLKERYDYNNILSPGKIINR